MEGTPVSLPTPTSPSNGEPVVAGGAQPSVAVIGGSSTQTLETATTTTTTPPAEGTGAGAGAGEGGSGGTATGTSTDTPLAFPGAASRSWASSRRGVVIVATGMVGVAWVMMLL